MARMHTWGCRGSGTTYMGARGSQRVEPFEEQVELVQAHVVVARVVFSRIPYAHRCVCVVEVGGGDAAEISSVLAHHEVQVLLDTADTQATAYR